MSSLLVHAQRTDWQLFVTCTYKNSRTMAAKARYAMIFEWLRRLAAMHGGERKGQAALRNLRFLVREEFGEQNLRLHWHALIYGLPQSLVRPTTCMFMMGYWEGNGGGMARVRVYDANLDGAAYTVKGLEGDSRDWTNQGANTYEIGKFNGDDTLMLIPSHSLLADWRAKAAESGRLTRLTQDRRRTAR